MAEAVLEATDTPAVSRSVNRNGAAVAGLTLIALVIRAAGINHESLWLDEGYTLLFSRLPFPQLISVGGAHEHPPLFYVLCHLLFGVNASPLMPRLVSLVAGTLLIPLVYFLGRRLLSPTAGLLAALLIAISPLAIWYSQDGRAYALASLLVAASYLLLLRAIDGRSRADWTLYCLCVLACLYTEYTTIFALVPHVFFLRRARRELTFAGLAVFVGYLPWLSVLLHNTMEVAGDYWIPPPTLGSVTTTALGFLGVVTPCPSPPCSGFSPPGIAAIGTLLAALLVVALAILTFWSWRARSWSRMVLLTWLLCPFVIILALAPFRSLYLDRAFVDSLAPFALLLAAGVLALPLRLGAGLAAVVLASNLATSTLLFTTHSNPDWRSLARDFAAAYRPGDAIMYNPGVLKSLLSAYLPSDWHPTRERGLWSRSYVDVPGWQKYYPRATGTDKPTRMYVDAVLRNRQLRSVSTGERNVWLVTLDYSGLNDTRRWFISHGFQPRMSELYDGDSRLELWSKDPPSALGPAVVPARWGPRWKLNGQTRVAGGVVLERQHATLARSFAVGPGGLYSVQVHYRSQWGFPLLSVDLYDRNGALLATFPRTKWYGFPANGVWLSQPFGFIAPPGAVRARITAATKWGQVAWQTIAVYRSPG